MVVKEMRMHSSVVLFVDDDICMNCTNCQLSTLLHSESGLDFSQGLRTAGEYAKFRTIKANYTQTFLGIFRGLSRAIIGMYLKVF